MKNIAFLIVFVPAAITLVSAGMLVFGMHSPMAIPAWFLWEVSLSAALTVLVNVGVIAGAWLFLPPGLRNNAA